MASMSRARTRVPRWLRLPDLTFCPACASRCVAPLAFEPEDASRWWMRLRCGECGDAREVIVSNAMARRYDEALDRATAAIEGELARLERERMETDASALIAALARDLIDAGD